MSTIDTMPAAEKSLLASIELIRGSTACAHDLSGFFEIDSYSLLGSLLILNISFHAFDGPRPVVERSSHEHMLSELNPLEAYMDWLGDIWNEVATIGYPLKNIDCNLENATIYLP
jgi:hypothetical protein